MLHSCTLRHHSPLLQSDRSRGFGFIKMSTVAEAEKCIQELNGVVRAFS